MGGSKDEDTIAVRRSSGDVEELSPEQLEELNYQRKVRDQEATGRLLTPKQINIFAVALCVAVLVYALPRIFFSDDGPESTYIPLSERADEDAAYFESENQQSLAPIVEQAVSIMNGMADAQNTGTFPDQTDDTPSAEILALMKQQQEVALRSEVTDSIQQWASDWSEQDIDAYLSHYSDKFVSDTGMNIDEWSAHRAERVARPTWVQVMLLDIQLDIVSDSLVRAEFTQNYSASNYQDISSKTLSLEATDDGWKILTEASPK